MADHIASMEARRGIRYAFPASPNQLCNKSNLIIVPISPITYTSAQLHEIYYLVIFSQPEKRKKNFY